MLKSILSVSLALSIPAFAFAVGKNRPTILDRNRPNFETLKSVVTTRGCYKSEESFRGCVYAVNTVLESLELSSKFVPTSIEADTSMGFGASVKNFGKLSLVKSTKISVEGEVTPRLVFKKIAEQRKTFDSALKAAFESGAPLIDFSEVLAHALAEVVKNKDSEAINTAMAINAYLREALDPHSHIEPVAQQNEKMADSSENFYGIGADIKSINKKILIASPMEGSPALKAGLRPNDEIIGVDDFIVEGKSVQEAVDHIRGRENTTVVLKILRKGQELSISIPRGRILVENVSSKLLEDSGVKVGYIKLRSFVDRNSCRQIEEKVIALEGQGATSLILDLRRDPGGLLDQANCIGGLFVGQQVITKVKDLQSNTFESQYSSRKQITHLPMVVMIDSGSASASEIVSGALQDYKRAWIVGERSYGKATVQSNFSFMRNPRIMLFRTIQRFYQPGGRTNQVVGIQPNFEVADKPDATEDERFRVREGEEYPNALSALSEPWVETRPEEASKIRSCMASTREARDIYEKRIDDAVIPDYQLLFAEEVLRCSAQTAVAH